MADWPSGFVLLGVVPLVALLFFGCIVWSATLLLKIRSGGARIRLPFLICALTLAVLAYAPLQQIALQQNFGWHREDRERIVVRVEAGELKPNVDYNKNLIALGDREPNVSAGGNDIVVDETDEGTYVLFLTSRGLKHYFTGFLRVPPAAIPKNSSSSRTSHRANSSATTRTGTSWRTRADGLTRIVACGQPPATVPSAMPPMIKRHRQEQRGLERLVQHHGGADDPEQRRRQQAQRRW
jgi:hypothetical protein